MKYLLVLILLTLTGCFGKKAEITGKEGQLLPEFNILLIDSNYMNTKNIKSGKPTVFFIFSTYCPYCKSQLLSILDDTSALRNAHIYMISKEPMPELIQYYQAAHLEKYPNISMGVDTAGFLGDYMNIKGIPYLALYDSEKKLRKAYLGPTNISTIKKTLTPY